MLKKQVRGEGLCWQRALESGFLSSPAEILSVGAALRLTRAERHLVFLAHGVCSAIACTGGWAMGN